MFNDSVGAINAQVIPLFAKIFPFLDGILIPWKTDPTWTKIALIMMQGWLGFPYIYVLTLGILQSIPNDLYEAAYIDGGPGSVGGNAGSTDILISWIYKLTTNSSPQYSMAAAVTLIISVIVISISMIAFKKLHAFDMEDV